MSRSRKPYHHGNLRRALLDAALAFIDEKGPHSFSMQDLARRAGVSSGAPYRHFRSKDDLLAEIAREGLSLLEGFERDMMARCEDPSEHFRAAGVAHVLFAVTHPAHFRILFSRECIDAEALPELARRVNLGHELADQLFQESQLGTDAPVQDPRLVMLTAQATMHGLARLFIDGQLPRAGISSDQAEAIAMAVSAVLGHGLLPRE